MEFAYSSVLRTKLVSVTFEPASYCDRSKVTESKNKIALLWQKYLQQINYVFFNVTTMTPKEILRLKRIKSINVGFDTA